MTQLWTNNRSTTIPGLLKEACQKWPKKVFLDFPGEKFTFEEADSEVTRLAHGFAAEGIVKGDCVCYLLDSSSDAIFIWFAVNKLGAIGVPINTDFKGDFLQHQIVDAGASIIVVDTKYADRIAAIEDGLPAIRTLVYRGVVPDIKTRLPMRDLSSLRSDSAAPFDAEVGPSDIACLIYTSGTTGPSKGCMVSHNYACNFGRLTGWSTGITSDDVYWTACPLFHSAAAFGIILNALQFGATAAIYPHFSVSKFWEEMERSGATSVMLLSVMFKLLADAPVTDAERRYFGKLRVVFGAPFGAAMKARWRERFGVKYTHSPGYGMTEACMVMCYPLDVTDAPPDASGRRFEDFDVRIVDDAGNECPPDVPGELYIRPNRPDIMFSGYWRRPEATLAIFRDLWFHSGDIGKVDKHGFFYFVDRKKDYLRKGGENISSFEVERTFLNHPAIEDVAVHAVLSELSEDELKATIVLKAGAALAPDELCRWSVDRLPHFCVPRYIEFRTHLPKTQTGRTQKHVLRSEGVTEQTWDRKTSDIVISRGR